MKRGSVFYLVIVIFFSIFLFNISSVFGLTAITNCTDLQNMKNNLTENYYLANNIDCSDTINWNSGNGFEPVGDFGNTFRGSFYGNNHTINSLFINRSSTDYIGLIGYSESPTIKDLEINNSYVKGHDYVGCISGLVSNIENSFCSGTVSGNLIVGGLAGWIQISVSNSYSSVAVSGGIAVGGLIGQEAMGSNVINSYSIGAVSGSSSVGGLVGTGSGVCTNSFWDNQTSGQTTSACGTGKNTADMKNQTTFTDAGWDFTTIWKMSGSVNDGYPYLRAFEGQPHVLIQVVYPTQNINVTRYSWFNITLNVTCLPGPDCGKINVSLDPETGRVIAHSANFPDSNIKIVEKFPEKQEKRNFFSRIIEFFKRVF